MTSHEALHPDIDTSSTTEVAELPSLHPRIGKSLQRLDGVTSRLAGSYFKTATDLKNKAGVLLDQLSDLTDEGVELNANLTEAEGIRDVAIDTEASCRLERAEAQARFDEVDNRKNSFLKAGKAPFEELALESIEDESDVKDVVQQFRQQLLTVLSITEPTEEGGPSILDDFFADYVAAQEDLRVKVLAHQKSERELASAQNDVAFFEAKVGELDQRTCELEAQLNKSIRRHDTGVKHIKGERPHQRIMDGLGSMGIIQAMRMGAAVTGEDIKQLESNT